MSGTLEVLYNHFDEIVQKALEAAQESVKDTADGIKEDAQAEVPVKTGSAQAGIYVSTKDSNGYNEAAGRAQGLNPHAEILPPVPQPTEPTEAIVATAVAHNTDLEYGTRFMPAHPYMTPAAEIAQAKFVDRLTHALGDL